MKTRIGVRSWCLAAGVAAGLMSCVSTKAQYGYDRPNYGYDQPDYDNRDYQGQPNYGQPDFYGDLAPYGQWVQTPEYGRVWIPNAGSDFQPYASNGHWVVTEWGNTWVSDYDWGWAPFHYGRWYRDPYRGWAWVPGYDWGPAWVSWRSGGGYYGWAPLGPGVNINVNIPAPYWVFVPQTYITHPRPYDYCVPRPRVVNIYQQTTIINNVYQANNRSYAYGPRREEIESVTRRSVPVYQVENTGRPGRATVRENSVGIYRPDMNGSSRGTSGRYPTERGAYSNRDNTPNAGNVGRAQPNDRTNARVPDNRQPEQQPYGRSRGGWQGQNSGYGQQSPANQAPQQAEQTYPQRGRQNSYPQQQTAEQGRRQERYAPNPNGQGQPQAERQGTYQPRGRNEAPTQSTYPENNGRSRGPR